MAVTWRGLHRGLGLATVLIFLGTGLYMRYREPPVAELEMGLRMLFRSRHIYILLTGLLNLLLGLHLSSSSAGWPRWLAAAGSALVALSPLLAVAAFFHDGEKLGSPGPLGFFAIEAAFAGSLLHLLSALAARRASPATGGPSGTAR